MEFENKKQLDCYNECMNELNKIIGYLNTTEEAMFEKSKTKDIICIGENYIEDATEILHRDIDYFLMTIELFLTSNYFRYNKDCIFEIKKKLVERIFKVVDKYRIFHI